MPNNSHAHAFYRGVERDGDSHPRLHRAARESASNDGLGGFDWNGETMRVVFEMMTRDEASAPESERNGISIMILSRLMSDPPAGGMMSGKIGMMEIMGLIKNGEMMNGGRRASRAAPRRS